MAASFSVASSLAYRARSCGEGGLPNHCILLLTKIWTMSQPMETPRCKAFQAPPLVDMCAPKTIWHSGRNCVRRQEWERGGASPERGSLPLAAAVVSPGCTPAGGREESKVMGERSGAGVLASAFIVSI